MLILYMFMLVMCMCDYVFMYDECLCYMMYMCKIDGDMLIMTRQMFDMLMMVICMFD